jgi:hypothetical protein
MEKNSFLLFVVLETLDKVSYSVQMPNAFAKELYKL